MNNTEFILYFLEHYRWSTG